LGSLEHLLIQNGRLLTQKDFTLEGHLSDVEPVSQEMGRLLLG
jgi:hypothetical protein